MTATTDEYLSPGSPDFLCELRSPAAYPHSVPAPVVLHETHISWVLLAGNFAYKIKKPVTTDFLDYGDLRKRHHACCEELRLGTRYTEGLYLDVVPITVEDGHLHVDGDGQPVEFAVRMRRFPEGALLSEQLIAGQVTDEAMQRLGETVAGFHRRAAVHREDPDTFLAQTLNFARANFRALAAWPQPEGTAARAAIERWTEENFSHYQGHFRRRIQEGFVRECHGDLHSENIVRWHDHWVPFDGIEFNEALSRIDVLNDIGFLVIDLQARGSRSLAASLLNAYLEQSGDYDALLLLRWYLVYRGMVRAKVLGMRAAQAKDRQAAEAASQQSRHWLELALATSEPSAQRPELWITHGVSGSGKTTGSQPLIGSRGAVRLRSDIERKRLFGAASSSRSASATFGQGMYSAKASEATYQLLLLHARNILRAGYPVIVDATFLKQRDRLQFHRLAQAEGVPFGILDFQVDETTIVRRLAARAAAAKDASDADETVFRRQLTLQEPLTDSEKSWVIPSSPPP
jgi:aminoglycoside phosphotransferase family enzyme/predicted kinase